VNSTGRTGSPPTSGMSQTFDACQQGAQKIEAELGPSTCWSTMPGSPATRHEAHGPAEVAGGDRHHLGGCFNMAKAVFEGMLGRGYGRIVNIGSINGQAGHMVRSIMPPRNPAFTASPRRWRRRARALV